ncbi:PD40 domain-containing protein [Candidatus Poribacteria bacterium]|nr:PD40 domain-containing protein [Candidatus Poribacteria bacterium]
MRADGSEVSRLTNGLGAELLKPVWSPDGKQILFYSNLHKIYQIDSDGKDLKMVAEDAGVPAWFDPKFPASFAVSPVSKL